MRAFIRTYLKITLVLAVLAVVGICGLVALAGRDARTRALDGPATTLTHATLVCADCAAIGMDINLWDGPRRGAVTGRLRHNTNVLVHETTIHDGVEYFLVSAQGQEGWVSADFVEQ